MKLPGVFFDGADHAASNGLEGRNPTVQGTILKRGNVVSHRGEVIFGLIYDTGDAILLEVIDAFHAFVFKRVETKRDEVERCRHDPKGRCGQHRRSTTDRRQGHRDPDQNRADDFTR